MGDVVGKRGYGGWGLGLGKGLRVGECGLGKGVEGWGMRLGKGD